MAEKRLGKEAIDEFKKGFIGYRFQVKHAHMNLDLSFLSAYEDLGLNFEAWLNEGKVGKTFFNESVEVTDIEDAPLLNKF